MAHRHHRIRHHAGRALAGGKGTLLSAATGAATGALSAYAVSAVPFLASNWWAMPAALTLVGHFLKRKNPMIGGALLGVAGYWAYNSFMASRAQTAKGLPSGQWGDAGMVQPSLSGYADNSATSSSPFLASAQAAMLMQQQATGFAGAQAGDYPDAGELVGDDAMGLET